MSDVVKKRVQQINIVGSAVLVIAVACTGLFGVLPLIRSAKANQGEIVRKQEELNKLDGLSRTLVQVDAELKNTQTRLKDAEARLPSSNAMDQFIKELAAVADATGLKVEGINPKQLQQGDNYRVMPFQITGTGSWETCYNFLTGLRKMNRLTRLDDLVLELNDPSPDSLKTNPNAAPVCKISVGISTFMAR